MLPRPYRALQIATGSLHSCALLENHRVKCWGMGAYGALGLGDQEDRGGRAADLGDALPFVDLGTGHTAKAIAAGRYTTCAIQVDDDSAWRRFSLRPARRRLRRLLAVGGGRSCFTTARHRQPER